MSGAPYIVALGGALRSDSTTEKALRLALSFAERTGARTLLLSRETLDLPLYSPDIIVSPAAQTLVSELARADGIIIGSPAYHGSISGVIKNALDYCEGLRTDRRPYFSGRAVGCIATGGGLTGAVHTLGVLRDIVHALRGWPTPMGAAINTQEPVFDDAGACIDPRTAQSLEIIAMEVMSFVRTPEPAQ